MYRNVDADYYGYRDEEDGEILEYEAEREKELIELLKDASYQPSDLPDEMDVDGSETNEESSIHVAISETLAKGAAVPTQQEIEQILVQRRRQQVSIFGLAPTCLPNACLLTCVLVTGQIRFAGHRRERERNQAADWHGINAICV